MTGTISIRVDALTILGLEADGRDAGAVRALLEDALGRLAARLARSPFARADARALALERLELDTLSADDVTGVRGAERLADELYAAIARRLQ